MTQTEPIEKRQYQPRLPANMAAQIMAPRQVLPARCLVLEISQFGAKLLVDSYWVLPRTFWLRLEGDAHLHPCVIVWRDGQLIGVDFQPGNDSSWWKHSQAAREQFPTRVRI
jgi:hypothetical protein